MRIAGGTYHVETARGRVTASLRGRVKRDDDRIVSVGDLVELERVDEDVRIASVLPRSSALTRHGVARRREQVIVANVDQVAVVVAAGTPDPDLSMIDRLIVLAELGGIDAFLVLNKMDLAEDEDGEGPAELEIYRQVGYDVLGTSVEDGRGLDDLERRLAGRITVLTGQSGVGKSSLLNALLPELGLRVGEVGERKGRGRHTTVAAALYPHPAGGHVADTPGLQYLRLWEVDPVDLDGGFVDFEPHAAGCRFADCLHREEPGCGVIAAVSEGAVDARRYESYLRLLDEARR